MNNVCFCGTAARFVNNGVNEKLNYWYCDECKDVAKFLLEPDEKIVPSPEEQMKDFNNPPTAWPPVQVDPSAFPAPGHSYGVTGKPPRGTDGLSVTTHGTKSGRFSSSQPNVSNIPKPKQTALEIADKLMRESLSKQSKVSYEMIHAQFPGRDGIGADVTSTPVRKIDRMISGMQAAPISKPKTYRLSYEHPFWKRRVPTSRVVCDNMEIFCMKGDKVCFMGSEAEAMAPKEGVYRVNMGERIIEWVCPLGKSIDGEDYEF